MGFRKGSRPKDVAVIVPHPWDGAVEYTFHLTKNPPKEAVEAGDSYFAAAGEERAEERRKSVVRAVASMMTAEPEGFDDFPVDERPLTARAVEYFDDEGEPDFEKILVAVWTWYLREGTPRAYFKSVQNSRAGDGDASRVSGEAPPQL